MSGIEVSLDAKAVEQAIVDAVLKSALGPAMVKAIDETLTKREGPYGHQENLLQRVVGRQVETVVAEAVCAHLQSQGDKIRALVADAITDEFLNAAVGKTVARIVARSERD